MLLKLRAATSGACAVAGSWTVDTACCTSASLAFMSVPNSYSTVMMLMPSLENESYCLTPLEVPTACSSGAVTSRSMPARRGSLVRGEHRQVGEGEVGDQLLLQRRDGDRPDEDDGDDRQADDRTVAQGEPRQPAHGVPPGSSVWSGSRPAVRLAARKACQRSMRPGISDWRKPRKSLASVQQHVVGLRLVLVGDEPQAALHEPSQRLDALEMQHGVHWPATARYQSPRRPGSLTRSTRPACSRERAAVLTAALLTSRASAIPVRDWTAGRSDRSQAVTRPAMRVPPISLVEQPELLREEPSL